MRTFLHRPLIMLAASAVALSAFSTGPLPAAADPAPAPTPATAPTTTITAVGIPTASAKAKELSRKQAGTDQRSAQPGGPSLVAALPEQTTKQFSTIGVTWRPTKGSADATVQARTKAVGGTWTEWTELENESAESPAGATRVGTSPVYVGESDGVQIKITSDRATTTLPDLQVNLIGSPEVASDARPATAAATLAAPSLPRLYPRPAIVTRAGWKADESWRKINDDCAVPDIDDTIQAAVVHHTAGSNTYSASQVPSIMRGMYAYHVKTQGWCDIGYNFVVDKFGKIWEGRAGGVTKPVHGAHATSWNTDTFGVSMIGNYETATPTAAAMESMAKLIAWKLEGYYRNPTTRVTLAKQTEYRIFGHGDVMQTSCPGRNLRSRLPALRSNVATKIGSYNTPVYKRWIALGGEAGWVGSPHIGEAAIGDGRTTEFVGGTLFYQPSLGTFWLRGDIRKKYAAVKATASPLGWPTSDQLVGSQSNYRVNRFQNGAIYWSGSTGAVMIHHSMYTRYVALGGDRSVLGLPSADQATGPIAGATQQRFVAGYLLSSAATGVQPVLGGIAQSYLGYSTGGKTAVGLPVAPQTAAKVPGVVVQRFQHGAVYYYDNRGRAVHSAIWTTYAQLGAETSRLGLPTSNNHAISGGSATNFQHGRITLSSATGKTTVTYF